MAVRLAQNPLAGEVGCGGRAQKIRAGAGARAPSAGRLYKEGGRKGSFAMGGWKRRWFVLPQGGAELKYYESPTSSAP